MKKSIIDFAENEYLFSDSLIGKLTKEQYNFLSTNLNQIRKEVDLADENNLYLDKNHMKIILKNSCY